MFHLSPKIIAPILLIVSFFIMIEAQIYFENKLMAKETHAAKLEKEKMNHSYGLILSEAYKKGFKYEREKSPVLLVNFWASWCTPCIAEFKSLKKMKQTFSKVTILGVNQDSSIKEMRKAQKKNKLSFFSFLDRNTALSDKLKIENYPYSLLFCKGELKEIYAGETDFMDKKIIKLIKDCLASS